jgi:hypothetical protein
MDQTGAAVSRGPGSVLHTLGQFAIVFRQTHTLAEVKRIACIYPSPRSHADQEIQIATYPSLRRPSRKSELAGNCAMSGFEVESGIVVLNLRFTGFDPERS